MKQQRKSTWMYTPRFYKHKSKNLQADDEIELNMEEYNDMDIEQENVIYLNGDITKPVFDKVFFKLKKLIDTEEPIVYLIINSLGGEASYCFALLDTILAARATKTKVITCAIGYACSSGALLLLAGNQRYATRNTFILTHPMILEYSDELPKLKEKVAFDERTVKSILKKLEKNCKNLISIPLDKTKTYLGEDLVKSKVLDGYVEDLKIFESAPSFEDELEKLDEEEEEKIDDE